MVNPIDLALLASTVYVALWKRLFECLNSIADVRKNTPSFEVRSVSVGGLFLDFREKGSGHLH